MSTYQYHPTRQRSLSPVSIRAPSISNFPLSPSSPSSPYTSRSSFSTTGPLSLLSPRSKKASIATALSLFLLLSLAFGRSFNSSSLSQSTAKDGTPRASSFRPMDSTDPSKTLTQFIDSHFGSPNLPQNEQPYIWVTMADALWAREAGTQALHAFVEQLNSERRAKYGKSARETKLVVLCLDEECIDIVGKYKDEYGRAVGGYAYGGFMWSRPEKILVSTWPKLASLIEILPQREVFFIDSDVYFKRDPYPEMEPFMAIHDIVAQENDAFGHLNTGWMYLRQSQVTADAWNAVYEMDLQQTSRDQYNFNTVLDTGRLRTWENGSKPLKSDFVASNGLKVHILDDNLFYSYHFLTDRTDTPRDSSLYLHMTCGDDALTKSYVAKASGFWTESADRYYTQPLPLLTIDLMSGSTSDLVQLFKVLLATAYYTQRAILPPAQATFFDLESPLANRPIFSSFPIPHISDALNVSIVEPQYREAAARELSGGSVLGNEIRADWDQLDLSKAESRRRQREIVRLGDVIELDMRQMTSFGTLLSTLQLPKFSNSSASVIKLVNLDWLGAQHWRDHELPSTLDHVSTCHELRILPSCGNICRWPTSTKQVRVDSEWPPLEELLSPIS